MTRIIRAQSCNSRLFLLPLIVAVWSRGAQTLIMIDLKTEPNPEGVQA